MTRSPESCVLMLEGEWDLARREELRARVEAVLAHCDPSQAVVVDMRSTTFVDSSALSVLVMLHNRLRAADRRLITLCGTDGAARRTIELLGLNDRLGVLDSDSPAESDEVAS